MIIGLIGQRGAGKTTIAKALAKALGFQHISFANELRAECTRRWPNVDFYDHAIKDEPHPVLDGRTPREVLIQVGTHEVRASDPDHWLRALQSTVRNAMESGTSHFVVDDARFLNELEWIAANGFIVKLEAPHCQPDDPTEPSEVDRITHGPRLAFGVVPNPKTPGSDERVVQVVKRMIARYVRSGGAV